MVFESVVVDILNKFLGDYVENLDRSQLKIGIWGGDVSLKNLTLKPSALDELNLPVKTIYGHLGKLILKIPWKNIYTAPVEVSVENLFLLVNPIQDVVYNPEKEEKLKQEAKQALINKVELAKKTEKEKDGTKVDDTFVEKLAAQIVKNVQIFIQDIHVRYEDRITKPERPFSIGMSLHTLKLHTTNETCDRYILPPETSPIFYKIMVMEGLSVYWNTNSHLFTGCEKNEETMIELFRKGISSKSNTVPDYLYILGPINAESKLQINSKPEMMNFVTPKMFLSLVLEQLYIHLNRSQYQDLISLVETFDRMFKGAPYRQYRPNLHQYKGHYKEWWKFAITCVLEEDVRRKFKNWNWDLMSKHRALCKSYEVTYRAKLTRKPNEQNKSELARLELELDAFNIILLRQKVENEVEREGRIVAEQKASKKGWLSGWFSGNKTEAEDGNGSGKEDLVKKFENAMTDEEKQKLYRAIDYHESSSPTSYPTSFVAIRSEFILRVLRIEIVDDYSPTEKKYISVKDEAVAPSVLRVEFKEAFVALQQRPAAQSIALSIRMQSFQTFGLSQNDVIPQLIKSMLTSVGDDTEVFLNVVFEINPEDEKYDQRLHVKLNPLKVIYDAQTVIRILEVFTPEKDISTVKTTLQAAANTKFEAMKEKSALRFQYAIEKSLRLDLQVDLMAPYLLIPFGGFYTENEPALVLNLGRITVESKSKGEADYNVRKMISDGRSKDEVLSQMMSQCYDHFSVCLGDVQVLTLRAGESWRPTVVDLNYTYDGHILRPTSIYVDIYKCLIEDDPRLPKIKVEGNLPDVTIKITEKKLLEIVALILSLPLPQNTSPDDVPDLDPIIKDDFGSLYDSASSLRHRLESFNKLQFSKLRKYRHPVDTASNDELDKYGDGVSITDFINLQASFNWKALTMYVESDNLESPLIEASLSGLELQFVQRTYSCEIIAKLGNISLTQNYENSFIPAISTPMSDADQSLFSCKLLMAEKDSPVFEKLYNTTAIALDVDFTKLYVVAHQEAILTTIEWVNNLQSHVMGLISARQAEKPQEPERKISMRKPRKISVSSNASGFDIRRKKLKTKTALSSIIEDQLSDMSDERREKKHPFEVTELKVAARLSVIQVCLLTASRPLATMDVDGFNASVAIKKSSTHVDAILQSVSIGDLNPDTIYHQVAYFTEGKDALRIQMVLYNEERVANNREDEFDVFVKLQMNCLQCVFINEFLMDVLEFANNFQTSKQILVEASAAAVASAKSNMQQVYQSSTSVSLDIYADAPVIVVPRNNQSNEIFIIDFGNLSVKNTLKKLPPDSAGHSPIIDEIFTNLQDMKAVRTNFERTVAEHVLLLPVNYTLVIKRNLSNSWYNEAPDLDIDGAFCPIHISITDQDYKLLMKTLNENIGASQEKSSKFRGKSKKLPESKSVAELTETTGDILESEVIIECEDVTTKEVRTMLKFAMAIESVTIDLFSGCINECQENGLAKFTLSFLCVKGCVLTNNDVSVHALLSDCCIDDTRLSKKANKVKRYMKRKTAEEVSAADVSSQWLSSFITEDGGSAVKASTSCSSDVPVRSMIDVTFEKKINQTRINARVFSFILIFNVDHLTKIQEFFMSELKSDSSAPSNIEASKKSGPVSRIETTKTESTESVMSVTSCSIVVEKPDIILVENLDDINTNAIILNNEANLNVQFSDDGRVAINGVLKNLQLYSCCYNPAKRSQSAALILHPLTVNLIGSTADDNNLHLDVTVSDIMISITAGTIELLSKISATLIPTAESEAEKNEINLKDFSNIWQQHPVRNDYWFLQTVEEGVDVTAMEPSYNAINISESSSKRLDVVIITAPCIEVSLEAGMGKKTLPLLALQSSFRGTMTKSAELIFLESFITLEIGYYNSRLALWEPIVEPILKQSVHSHEDSVYVPWQMQFNVQIVNKDSGNYEDAADNPDTSAVSGGSRSLSNAENFKEQPALALAIKSEERMELTCTKTCLDVVKTLTHSFNNAVYLKSGSSLSALNEVGVSSYVLVNDFGVDMVLSLSADGLFRLLKGDANESINDNSIESVTIRTGDTVNLLMKKEQKETQDITSSVRSCLLKRLNIVTDQHRYVLHLRVPDKNKDLLLPVSRADKRFFSLRTQGSIRNDDASSEFWGLVSEVDIVDGSVVTTLRSVVRIFNHFSVDIHVFYLKTGKNKNEIVEAGKVGPSQHLNVPVQAVYTSNSHLYFAPANYSVSGQPFIWKDLLKTVSLSQQVQCISKNAENEDPFFIRILGEMEQIYYENSTSYTIASTVYNIHLRPTLILKNFLPINVVCCLQGVVTEHVLKPGQRINISTAEPDHSTIVLRLDNYLDKDWSCKKTIKSDTPVFSVWAFTSYDSEKPFSLNLGVWYSNCQDSMIFALYCPFWMVNKTGLNLSYKGVEDGGMILHHPKDFDEPILFSFKEKSFFSKKKACVRVNDGDWSDKLSIDAAGSSGSVACHYKNQQFQLGVYIKLNGNSLTKQVIFSPFYTLANNCPFEVEFREDKAENVVWNTISPAACIAFWPTVLEDKNKTLELRICGTNEITPSFSYLNIRIYPLMLLNKFGGIAADVQVTEGGVYIAISPFQPRMAPALIVNDTDSPTEFIECDLRIKSLENNKEKENAVARCLQNDNLRSWQLGAKKEILFNWSTTNAMKPVLLIHKNANPIDLRKDGIGEFSYNENGDKKYWISFLNGMQRVLLITTDDFVLKEIEAIGDFECVKQEICISLEGIGLSLVNNISKQELLYIGISSSGVIWETQKKTGKRFKPVSDVLNDGLEKAYLNYCNVLSTTDDPANVDVDQEIDLGRQSIVVNFSKGIMIRPTTGNLRRTYNSGFWIQVRSSERYQQIHAKVHRLQMDNQIYDCVFPVIFSPVPPPKSVAAGSDDDNYGQEKPFAELSIVQRLNEGSIRQFKYFKILIQEFHVKVDIGFINGLVKLFEADNITDEEEMAQFEKDKQVTKEALCVHVTSVTSQDFYDLLHFSPLKIHISFSLAGENPNDGTPQQGLPIVNLLTQSIGVTLTDVQDVVFRLAYFERKHKFYSQVQLQSEVQTHYTGQFVKQLYVLVLGLDVLGNPFGLVTGLKQGVEDFFYEPFQGAIQGPSEFAEGLLLGVRSLFGHTVGGAAGAVGRITGAMGKGIAALTLDDDYQKKRRQRLAQQQRSFTEGGRGLVMGVVEGVGGVFSKPMSGAREEGVGGFIKGAGKGVVGLFMRPASGVVDFASGTVDVVRRIATCSEEIRRYRLPRFIRENGLVLPFSDKEAQGFKYLLDIEKGKFVKTDTYLFHISMASGSYPDREILLITNNRVAYLVKSNDIFSDSIKLDWQYTWSEIKVNDGIGETENGFYIKPDLNDNRRPSSGFGAFGSMFTKSNKGKVLFLQDKQTRQWLIKKMKELVQKAQRY